MTKIAFVFPGQGSQKIGMLNDVAAASACFRHCFERAADLLGYDLWDIILHGPTDKLNQTCYTQPALLVADIAMWEVWREKGGAKPALVAGHSLGEYAALYAAEALSFDDAVTLVAHRAQFMQEAVPEGQGAMAAIVMLPCDQVADICRQAAQEEVVTIANINERNQMVIAGHQAAIDRAIALAKAAGAKIAKKLAVSVPSHCALMRPAAERLAQRLADITLQSPTLPVINNTNVAMPTSIPAITDALVTQLYQPVRWVETIELMRQAGVSLIVECGPNRVLSGQNRRICPEIETFSLNSVDNLDTLLARQQTVMTNE